MQHPNEHLHEGTIHAWLDGALNDDESARVAAHVESCPACATAVAEARGLIAAASRILGHLDDVPSNVIPENSVILQKQNLKQKRWFQNIPLQAAAALLLVAFGTSRVLRERQHTSLPTRSPEMHRTTAASRSANTSTPPDSANTVSASTLAAPAPVTPKIAYPQKNEPLNTVTTDAVAPFAARIAPSDSFAQKSSAADNLATAGVAMDAQAAPSVLMRDAARSAAPLSPNVKSTPDAPANPAMPSDFAPPERCDKKTISLRPGVDITVITADSVTITSPQCLPAEPKGTHTIRWTDSTTHRITILRGPISRSELDSLRHAIR